MQRIQERLKIRRNRLGWSQGTLAQKSGVAERLISSIESGEYLKKDVGLSLSTIEKLAEAMTVNPLWLLGSDRMDGNELLLEEDGKPDHTLEVLQKLTQAETYIDAAKRLLSPARSSTNYRDKLASSTVPSDALTLARKAEEKRDREHPKSK
jgi:transcriptional regulator with XRE-family HTH domain